MTHEERRAEMRGEIPRRYSGLLHLACTNLVSLAIVALCLALVRDARWYEWALCPSFFVFANFFEWWVHRGPMHHKRKSLAPLFNRHTLTHHAYFHPETMPFRSRRELLFVLFPIWIVPVFVILVSPIVLLLWLFGGVNLALLFLASAFAYYVTYEWFHMMHHLPEDEGFGASRFAKLCRKHHVAHHDPARMTEGNFNVSFPLADWVLGTLLRSQPRLGP